MAMLSQAGWVCRKIQLVFKGFLSGLVLPELGAKKGVLSRKAVLI